MYCLHYYSDEMYKQVINNKEKTEMKKRERCYNIQCGTRIQGGIY